jgi:hypothetical protein
MEMDMLTQVDMRNAALPNQTLQLIVSKLLIDMVTHISLL